MVPKVTSVNKAGSINNPTYVPVGTNVPTTGNGITGNPVGGLSRNANASPTYVGPPAYANQTEGFTGGAVGTTGAARNTSPGTYNPRKF